MAGKLDGCSPEQMGRDLNRFAREHLTTFLAASAAAVFAAARFLRAGADYSHEHSHDRETGDRSGAWDRTRDSRFEGATRTAQQRYESNQADARTPASGGMAR